MSLFIQKIITLISPLAYMYLFFIYPRLCILNAGSSCFETTDVFSIATHVFLHLFWKICPLLCQVLNTCLKCSTSSFLPFFYRKKVNWGQGSTKLIRIWTNQKCFLLFKITSKIFLGDGANLVTKSKIVYLNCNLVHQLIRIFRNYDDINFFRFNLKITFLDKFSLKIQICLPNLKLDT